MENSWIYLIFKIFDILPCRIFQVYIVCMGFEAHTCVGPICESKLIGHNAVASAKYGLLNRRYALAHFQNFLGFLGYLIVMPNIK